MSRFFKHSSLFASLCAMLILSLAGAMTSCSGDSSADISDLLSTVPNDASAVAAFNLRAMVEKTGSKIDGSKVVPGDDLRKLIEKSGNKSDLSRFITKDYGIDPEAAVLFVEGQDTYLSGYLANPDNFRKSVQEETSESFSKEGEVDICANYAMKGNQFWCRVSHRNSISASEISRFTSLSEKLSFMSAGYAKELSDLNHDIKGWGNISGLFNVANMDFQSKSMTRMAIESMFSDAEDIAFHADFEKGKMTSALRILNSKGKPAKFNFPSERVDLSVVKNAGASADLIFAMAISPKMIEQLKEQVDGKGISVLGAIMPALSALDGTAVIESGADSSTLSGVVSTKGEGTASLSDLISSGLGCTVTKDGKLLRFSNGSVSGKLTGEKVADKFKGALFGVVAVPDRFGAPDPRNPLENVAMMVVANDSSIELRVEADAKDKKENVLLSFIKAQI